MDDSSDISPQRQQRPSPAAGGGGGGNLLSVNFRRDSFNTTGKTMSVAAPESAAKIRSAVTGALRHDDQTGFFSFETVVQTTFVLPWDLNPRVEPVRFSDKLRSGIRSQLLDPAALSILEAAGALNWNTSVRWSIKNAGGGEWMPVDGGLFVELEKLYHTAEEECALPGFNGTVNFSASFLQIAGHAPQQLRRLECTPMMPLKVDDGDGYSLFHAASMGFWGVHDRTNLLRDAVLHSLSDMKTQFTLCKRWSDYQEIMAAQRGFQLPEATQEMWQEAKQTTPELHVFSLANVTQRPIIVYSPPQCGVGGIYLPLLWRHPVTQRYPSDKNTQLKNPLVLGFDSSRNRFVALATFKGVKGPNLILLPLVHSDNQALPVKYLSREEMANQDRLLQQLMNIYIHKSSAPSVCVEPGSPMKGSLPMTLHTQKNCAVPTAVLDTPALPDVMDSLMKQFETQFL